MKKEISKDDFIRSAVKEIAKKNHKTGVFFVTAAVAGARVHRGFLQTIEHWVKARSGKLVVLPMRAHVRALEDGKSPPFDPILRRYWASKQMVAQYTFNSNLRALDAELLPQQREPLTGLLGLGLDTVGKTSMLIASTQQQMKMDPTGNETHPRMLHGTGVITLPNYLSNRAGMLAEQDHVLGGLIVEIRSDRVFHVREVQADRRGSFIDLGTRYHANGTTSTERAEWAEVGDIHAGVHSDSAMAAWKRLFATVQPRRVGIQDVFDGISINPHAAAKFATAARLPEYAQSLFGEMVVCGQVMTDIAGMVPQDCEVVVKYSNHHDFLDRWLEKGDYSQDPVNLDLAIDLMRLKLDGLDPLKSTLDPEGKFRWLKPNEDLWVEGIQCGAHGHMGPNGARGSLRNLTQAFGRVNTGHSHTPEIWRGGYQVGHSSHDRHGYNNGPSTWAIASSLTYKGGFRQMIMVIDGEYCI